MQPMQQQCQQEACPPALAQQQCQQKAFPPESQLAMDIRHTAGTDKLKQRLQVCQDTKETRVQPALIVTSQQEAPSPCHPAKIVGPCPQAQPSLTSGGSGGTRPNNACCSMASVEGHMWLCGREA